MKRTIAYSIIGMGLVGACFAASPDIFIDAGPEKATVHLYAQVHSLPGNTLQEDLVIAEHQAELLERLLREQPQHLFLEGELYDWAPNTAARKLPGGDRLVYSGC